MSKFRIASWPLRAVFALTCAAPLQAATAADKPAVAGYAQTLELHGIRFEISSPNVDANNQLRIEPHGLSRDNTPIDQGIAGQVLRAEVADLDTDGSPEVYVYVRATAAGAATQLVAYAANRKRSLSGIHLPPIEDVPGAAQGYRGGEEMAVVETRFARRFRIDGGDRFRQLEYRLVPGEAGWLLQFERMTEF